MTAAKVEEADQSLRLTRKERQARTRERLIAVAREHFLRDGLGGAVAEKIAEEAGFTRGALYANFSGKEQLFLAVIDSSADAVLETFQSILESPATPAERLTRMQEAFGDLVTRPDWVLLQSEFQANGLRSERIRGAYAEHLERRNLNGARVLRGLAEQLGLRLSASPEEIALVLGGLAEAMAVRQALTGQRSPEQIRSLAMLCFDRLVMAGEPASEQ